MDWYISPSKSSCYHRPGNRFFVGPSVVGFLLLFFLYSGLALGSQAEIKPAAVVWYEELAAQGDVDAKYNLGMMNETGWSVPVDFAKAVHWYRDAAKNGHAESQLRLGMLYYLGKGSKQSKLKGEGWIRKAAKQGHKFAASLNSQLFVTDVSDTINTVKVLEKARDVYLKDEKNAVPTLKNLIRVARQEVESQKKEREDTTIRERREVRTVQQNIVDAIDKRTIQPKMNVKAKKTERLENIIPEFVDKESVAENRTLVRGNIATIRSQAKKGQASAQYNLGRMYELGIKMPVDKKEALAWYQKAAAQGYPDAEYRLAIAFLYGINVQKDEKLGRQWLSSASKHGHQVATNLMTKISSEEGVLRSGHSVAVDWYLEKAIVGDADSAISLGKIYEYGWGVFPDIKEAGRWYQKAVKLGSSDAKEVLKNIGEKLSEKKGESTQNDFGLVKHPALPSNWIAYLIAIFVAAFFFFSPLLLKRQRQKTEFDMIGKMDRALPHRKEPPFGQ